MKIIGVTGPSGSGKGTLCKALEKLGYRHIDTDALYHRLLVTCREMQQELIQNFGNEILQDGCISRDMLRPLVLGRGNEKNLALLNQITHKYVCRACIGIINEEKEKATKGVAIDAPLLFEARLNKICDTVVCVLCAAARRIARIMARDRVSETSARTRIAAQKDAKFYCRYCDAVFWNDGAPDAADAFAKDIDRALFTGGTT